MPVENLHAQLQHFKLLGGATAADLWPVINLVLPAWSLLALAPRWKHTPTLTLMPPIVHAMIYVGAALSLVLYPETKTNAPAPDFSTLEGVVALFQDPNGVFVGWEHYVCFDLLVGRMITFHSVIMNAGVVFHIFVVIPGLFLTLMAGPMGWLYYLLLSTMLLDNPADHGVAQVVPSVPAATAPKNTKKVVSNKDTKPTKKSLKPIPELVQVPESSPQKTKKSSPQKNKKGSPGKTKKA